MIRRRLAIAGFVALACSGSIPRRPTSPVPTLELGGRGDECLVVLLPGRWDGPEDFRRAGFHRILRENGVRAEIVAVDAHIGYYRRGTLVDRLREDVLEPAVRSGSREIWLAGVSLGGLGSLVVAKELPDAVTGIVALAPFLGEEPLIAEIEAAGGPEKWVAPPPDGERDIGDVWRWLREREAPPAGPEVVLGYGVEDDLARADGLMALLLPGDRVFSRDGGHDWATWSALWREIASSGLVCSTGGRW